MPFKYMIHMPSLGKILTKILLCVNYVISLTQNC